MKRNWKNGRAWRRNKRKGDGGKIYSKPRRSDDNELCGATHTRVARLWRERGCKTERHDGNYVCIIFNFSNILRRNGRRGSGVAPYEDSCDYEKLTAATVCATAFGIDDPDGSVKTEKSTWPRRIILFLPLFSLVTSFIVHVLYRAHTIRHIFCSHE